MEEDALKSNDKPWLFKKGQAPGPGRPKGVGKSLKEYAREYLANMTDQERLDYLDGLPKDKIWAMAEGNPDSKLQGDSNNPITLILKDINGNTTAEKLRTEELPNNISTSSSEI